MKKMQKLENASKLTLEKLKVKKIDHLISIKGGALLIDERDSEDDTWGS